MLLYMIAGYVVSPLQLNSANVKWPLTEGAGAFQGAEQEAVSVGFHRAQALLGVHRGSHGHLRQFGDGGTVLVLDEALLLHNVGHGPLLGLALPRLLQQVCGLLVHRGHVVCVGRAHRDGAAGKRPGAAQRLAWRQRPA